MSELTATHRESGQRFSILRAGDIEPFGLAVHWLGGQGSPVACGQTSRFWLWATHDAALITCKRCLRANRVWGS